MKINIEQYMLGQELIDTDHIVLFEIIEKSFKIYKDKFIIDKYDRIIEVIEELKDYTEYHFNREEEIMLGVKYNKFFSHKVQHIEFIKKLESLDSRQIDEEQDEEIRKLLDFTLEWLINHILYTDKLFVKFYNEIKEKNGNNLEQMV